MFRYGKRAAAPAAATTPPAHTATKQVTAPPFGSYALELASRFPSKATKTYLDIPAMFGRPPLSPAEIRAIETGGAY